MTIADRVAREIARDDIRREALGDTTPRPAHIPVDQWDAMTAEEQAAMGEWEVKMNRTPRPVPAATFAERETARFQALADERAAAQIESVARQVPTGTYNTVSGVTSSPLYGPRSTWARQIKALYASVQHVAINGRTVKAMHQGGQPFTLGFVTEHKGA